ncbi:energy-coupling factor ABC transporter ATP-binding protein [Paucidesulfovibrio longus]|uniref:energy-coupling factor ABC transporter ATP-binding protein n=1 Tax=Paucidesulfovibrio longus TaxID=889 RepID=UPI0003B5517A|nr:ABC transporter ATP-binding protein [Paucidesulfovibrio longus]
MTEPLYRLEGVRRIYGERVALDVPQLAIPEGGILGVAGHNGSGKSTLMRILAFLEAPDKGVLYFMGRPAGPATPNIRRQVALLTQEPYLLLRSVAANVGYGLKVRGGFRSVEIQARVNEALETVGLEPDSFARRSWRELSGGEAQRVALAARLALRPKVLLLDEPTSSLDPENAERIMTAAMLARREWGASLVIVSHDRNWLESVSDGVVLMERGRVSSVPEFCLPPENGRT